MPVKLDSKLPSESAEARIEIIPLIDIMFFLLASFMLVSLSMVNVRNIAVKLPTATTARQETSRDFLDVSVDAAGVPFVDKQRVGQADLVARLTSARQRDANLRVLISADRQCHHGDVIRVLDAVRQAGITNVAFEIGEEAAP